MEKKKRGSFTGHLGFVLAAAGSAVGVGNLWRFPYLAARDGGGLFIIIYLILLLTFGHALMASDIAIGRRTKKSSVDAYAAMSPKWKFLGIITFLVPVIIMTYYAVIGGWITRYVVTYFTDEASAAAGDGYFVSFITNPIASSSFAVLFMAMTAFIVYNGVEKGIERASRIMMPLLLIMIIAIAIYSLTLHHTDDDGTLRTGLDGLKVYLVPDLTGLTVHRFLQILLDCTSQLFFSLSVSMGIMITYGSYVKDEVDLGKSATQIEIFDTFVAVIAGAMIIPAIFVFTGADGMSSGPSLMFVSLPKVFNAMGGTIGVIIGAAFFIMATFAALTSCVSVLETVTSNCMEIFHTGRKRTTLVLSLVYIAISVVIALGYSVFYVEVPLPNGTVGQILDIMDYISNSVMMPFISILSSILIGWIMKPEWIIEEMEKNGEKMGRKKIYIVMIKYVTPIVMTILFIQSTGFLNFLA